MKEQVIPVAGSVITAVVAGTVGWAVNRKSSQLEDATKLNDMALKMVEELKEEVAQLKEERLTDRARMGELERRVEECKTNHGRDRESLRVLIDHLGSLGLPLPPGFSTS